MSENARKVNDLALSADVYRCASPYLQCGENVALSNSLKGAKMADEAYRRETPVDAADYPGSTLLEGFMGEALLLTMEAAADSQRMRGNLHPMATRALFLATEGIANLELLAMLKPRTFDADVDLDKKAARNLRSVGLERRQPLHRLQGQAVALMSGAKVPKADVARGWAIMLIFDAASEALREARKRHGPFDMDALQANPTWADEMWVRYFELVNGKLADGFDNATKKAERSIGVTLDNTLIARFLYFSASEIVRAMHHRVHPTAAYEHLLTVVYPAIEADYPDQDAP